MPGNEKLQVLFVSLWITVPLPEAQPAATMDNDPFVSMSCPLMSRFL